MKTKNKTNAKIWNKHYKKEIANQTFPDEELVRYFAHLLRDLPAEFLSNFPEAYTKGYTGRIPLLDFGSGSGRNGMYLASLGFDVYFNDYAPQAIKICEKKWNLEFSKQKIISIDSVKTKRKSKKNNPRFYVSKANSSEKLFPYANNSFAVVLAWGVLHYNAGSEKSILKDIQKVLISGGRFVGTLRAKGDTHLQLENIHGKSKSVDKGRDNKKSKIKLKSLKGASACLYSKEEVLELFKDFSSVRLGYMERSPLGDLDKKICHWVVEAIK